MRFISKIIKFWELIIRALVPSRVSMVSPKFGNIAKMPAADQKNGASESIYAVIGVEVVDYDPMYPPEIKTFDDTQGTSAIPLETMKFAPNTKASSPYPDPQEVPVFLAYDSDPWSRPGQEPEERITRIELHHNTLNEPLKAYVKLKAGTFVVPVYWYNVVDYGSECHVDPLDVRDLFWKVNKYPADYFDVNSIWVQANVQFRLLNTSIPFFLSSIPNHIVQPPEQSKAVGCIKKWTQDYNHNDAVDIYTVQELRNIGGAGNPAGMGNCHGQGFVFIAAGSPNSDWKSFNSGGLKGRAQVVAHELGHFLAYLPHPNEQKPPHPNALNNLMHSQLAGCELTQDQINLARQRIKKRGHYYESN